MNERLIHDHAFALATLLYENLAHLVRDEERRDLFDLLYETGHATLASFAGRCSCTLRDFAYELATGLFDKLSRLVREDEHDCLLNFFDESATAALESYDERAKRMMSRLNPSKN